MNTDHLVQRAAQKSPEPDGRNDPPSRWIDDEQLGKRRQRRRLFGGMLAGLTFAGLCAASAWALAWYSIAVSVMGIASLVVAAVVGVASLRAALSVSHPIAAVARVIVEEAVGTRLSILLVMLVLIGLPSLPLVLDADERLSYRLQFLLNWSLSGAFVLLAVVTIAVCCGSICGDISSGRIHLTLSKPLRRWEYLAGKWCGISLLNLLLISLVGIGTYATAQAVRNQPTVDSSDLRAVEEQVLTARKEALPVHPRQDEYDELVANEITRIRDEDPAVFDLDPVNARRRIRTTMLYKWHTVSPDVVTSFLFTGLDGVKDKTPVMQLRLKPFAPNSAISEAEVQFAIWLNERPFPVKDGNHEDYVLSVNQVHTIEVPTVAINDKGELLVTVANRNRVMPGESRPTSISITPGKGFQLLYRVGSFEANLVRAIIVLWAKLAVISAVALAAASWLGLPVAMLASMIFLAAALASGFLADAIDIYTGVDELRPTFVSMMRLRLGILLDFLLNFQFWSAIKTIGSYAADGFLLLVPDFSEYDSITAAATGKLVTIWDSVAAVLFLGFGYTSLMLVAGWRLLERRDLVGSS